MFGVLAGAMLIGLASAGAAPRPSVVVSVDCGTESLRAAVVDADGKILGTTSVPHTTDFPAPGHAEQSPADWWEGLAGAIKGALSAAERPPSDVAALCLATTSCTVMALDAAGNPLRPALLWMDARAAPQANEIIATGAGDKALDVNCGGEGPLSAEWMLPKALWIKQSEPEIWDKAVTICECQDWLNWRCTGQLVAGGCNVATRWHCDGTVATEQAAEPEPEQEPKLSFWKRRMQKKSQEKTSAADGDDKDGSHVFGGRPTSLLAKVGLADLADRWPRRCVAMGDHVGDLTAEAASHLGLLEGECSSSLWPYGSL